MLTSGGAACLEDAKDLGVCNFVVVFSSSFSSDFRRCVFFLGYSSVVFSILGTFFIVLPVFFIDSFSLRDFLFFHRCSFFLDDDRAFLFCDADGDDDADWLTCSVVCELDLVLIVVVCFLAEQC